MYPGVNEGNVETLILLGLIVIAEEPARQQKYTGADVAWEAFPQGFHTNMRDHFREIQRTVRNSLRHAKSGSLKLLDDGTVTWQSQQGKKFALTQEELRNAYWGLVIASSELVQDSIKVGDDGMINMTIGLSTFGTPDSSPTERADT